MDSDMRLEINLDSTNSAPQGLPHKFFSAKFGGSEPPPTKLNPTSLDVGIVPFTDNGSFVQTIQQKGVIQATTPVARSISI